ncbi:MFS transporter [Ahrensia sp. 13_GOM-1096m]|uniref:MFS transporter n=1 Tax=Ahrensia sp. 13_GOM-1096m TaxID=1380380 RepID=UPI00047E7388|nr:MFS transporter [Ahrensia sp. 13_GOM-1096m]
MSQTRTLEGNDKKRLAISALALSMMLSSLGTSIPNVALPTFSVVFSASFQSVQWIVTAYLLTLTLSVVVVGHLGDKFGLKQMLLFGLALYSATSLLCALAPNLWLLIVARSIQGIAAAILMTLTIALVHETAETNKIGSTMGLLGTMSALGTAIGPPLGGFLISAANWSSIFFILMPFSLCGAILVYNFLPTSGTTAKLSKIDLKAIHLRKLLPRLLANLLVAAVMIGTLIIGPFYLSIGLELAIMIVGLVMSVGPLISIFSGVASGRLVDLIGPNRVTYIGLFTLLLGVLGLISLPTIFGAVGYLIAIAILTPGYQLFQAANNTTIMAVASNDKRGIYAGLLSLSRNLGLVAGVSGLGAIFTLGSGTTTMAEASKNSVTNGMQLAFAVAAVLLIIAIILIRTEESYTVEV